MASVSHATESDEQSDTQEVEATSPTSSTAPALSMGVISKEDFATVMICYDQKKLHLLQGRSFVPNEGASALTGVYVASEVDYIYATQGGLRLDPSEFFTIINDPLWIAQYRQQEKALKSRAKVAGLLALVLPGIGVGTCAYLDFSIDSICPVSAAIGGVAGLLSIGVAITADNTHKRSMRDLEVTIPHMDLSRAVKHYNLDLINNLTQ